MTDRIDACIQAIFIRVCSIFFRASKRIPDQTRSIALQITCVFIPIYFIMIYSGKVSIVHLDSQFSRHVFGCIILLLILLFSIDREMKSSIRWRHIVLYPLLIVGLGIILIGFVHPVPSGYHVFALMLIFLFPAFAFVWGNRRDYWVLFDCVSRAIAVVGIVYYLMCIIMILRGEGFQGPRFSGTMSHAGNLSQFATSVLCSGLYLAVRFKEKLPFSLMGAVAIGIGLGMLLLGQGRSCILACIFGVGATVIFCVRGRMFTFDKTTIIRSVLSLLLILSIAGFTCALPVLTSLDGNPDAIGRFTEKKADLNEYSAGRVWLWTLIGSHLNLTGHDAKEESVHSLTKQPRLIYSHNVFLEISYYCGIPIGVLFIFIEIMAGLIVLRYMFSRISKSRFLLFPILFFIIYMFESMLDCAGMPFILESSCYYYLSMIPMLNKRV